MFSFNPRLNCIQNAFVNLNKAEMVGKQGRIWFVGGEVKHAYLEIDGEVLNNGVTWGNGSYPDYSTEELQELQKKGLARDITETVERAYEEDSILCIEGECGLPLNRGQIERYS